MAVIEASSNRRVLLVVDGFDDFLVFFGNLLQ
jgi:hypothetical protein